jgi:NADPH2:quinone reductase
MVHGASGGVGTAAVQIARTLGLKVIGTAGSDRGRQLAREQGAHEVFDHHAPDLADRVMAASEGRGPDIILEMLANVNLAKDLGMIAPRGRIVVIGNRGTVEINPRDAMSKDASILGMLLLNTTAEENKRIAAGLAAGFENKTLRPVVGKEIPLAEAPRAHESVLAAGAFGKITLIP